MMVAMARTTIPILMEVPTTTMEVVARLTLPPPGRSELGNFDGLSLIAVN